jgi:excisionase family DNA binding protein
MVPVLEQYPDLLTVQEVADILRVDRSYVYRIIRQGRLAAVRPTPHKTRIIKSDLYDFLGPRLRSPRSREQTSSV